MNKNQKNYRLTENKIIRISRLFCCFEDAVKEIIRGQKIPQADDLPVYAEMRLKEEIFNIQSNSSQFNENEF
jgi:hypothetical protein